MTLSVKHSRHKNQGNAVTHPELAADRLDMFPCNCVKTLGRLAVRNDGYFFFGNVFNFHEKMPNHLRRRDDVVRIAADIVLERKIKPALQRGLELVESIGMM